MPKTQNQLKLTGKIRYTMTNDYMFRAILQKNKKVLRGLVSSLLHMSVEEIKEITIENPIILGEAINEKTIVMDIHIKLNSNSYINLEMQVINKHDWTDRSLFYLCRTFGQLEKGDEYTELLPATHIGFLDFTLFPEHPEFFSTYKLLNTKNYHLYSDKFVLNVIDLNRTDLATEEDKAYQIDQWVKIFKVTTWEELHMLSQDNEYAEEIMNTMYECHTDAKICKQCSDRQAELAFRKMEERRQKKLEEEAKQLEIKIEEMKKNNAKLADENAQMADENAQMADENALLADENALLADENAQLAVENEILRSTLTDKDAQIAFLEAKLTENNLLH